MRKVSLLLILVVSALSLSAQVETREGISEQAGRKTTFTKNGFWDNWFIGAGVGANTYFGEWGGSADFFNRQTLMGNVQVGTWMSPYWGARVKATYGGVHTFSSEAKRMERFNLATGEINVMFDVTNYLGKYNENRFYSLIPYAGVGYAYARGYKNYSPTQSNGYTKANDKYEHSLTLNAGLINQFKITKNFAAQIEFSAIALKDNIDRKEGNSRAYDFLVQAQVGFIYKIGKNTTSFTEAHLFDQGRIDQLNDEINRLKRENDELSKRPKGCPECPEVAPKIVEVPTAKGISGNAVFFRINSATIDHNQEGNIYTVGKYLQANPNEKVTIVGYADKQTGSASINQKLSERRAKKVADVLVNQYKINRNRLDVQWKGDTVQPYDKNAWNRVVIFVSED